MIIKILKYTKLELIYFFVNTIYLFLLNSFNKGVEIFAANKDYFAILSYKDNMAYKFFTSAIILAAFAIWRMYRHIKVVLYEDASEIEIAISIIIIIILVISCILIVFFIQNPILKAIIIVMLAGSAIASFSN